MTDQTPAGVLISERAGSDRFLPIDVLVDHPGAIPDVSTVLPERRGRAVPVRLLMSTELPFVSVEAAEDGYVASIPTVDVVGGGYLLVGAPGDLLDPTEGGPVRLMVLDGSTLCWNVKHVTSLRATHDAEPDSVPENPPH